MNNIKHLLLLFCLTLFSQISFAQLPYLEDFSGQNGKGVVGPAAYTYDTSSVDWTIDVSNGSIDLADASDYFKVVSEVFEGTDLDGEAIWYSKLVDISSVSSVDLSVDLSETGSLAGTEYINVYYVLDGGAEIAFETNGENSGDFTSLTATHDSLSGSNLQIVIKVRNIFGTRIHNFDNVSIKENISNVQSPYVLHDASNINLKWTDPASSFDEVLVVANQGSALSSGIPAGNGSAYTANTTVGSGTSLLGGNVVYKGSGTDVGITGLTGGQTYYLTIFTRNGIEWSKGYSISTFYNPPSVGDVIISEYVRNSNTDYGYIELFNTTSTDINLLGCKMVVNNSASTAEIVDIGRDFDGVITVPANGFLILNRNRAQSNFESTWGITLASTGNTVNYNRTGINNFGNDKFFVLKLGGTEGVDDGTLIDETKLKTGGTGIKVYQMPLGHWDDNLVSNSNATPGYIEDYENFENVDLVYANGGWAGATGFADTKPSNLTAAGKAVVVDGQANIDNGALLETLRVMSNAGVNISTQTVVVSDSIILENDASLAVTSSGAISCSGTIIVQKESHNNNTDYNVWGTPFLSDVDITDVFTNHFNCDIYVFEASSQSWKYDEDLAGNLNCSGNLYAMNSSLGVSTTDGEGSPDGNFDIGRGYFIPGNAINTISFSKSSGSFNNGNVTVKLFGSSNTPSDGSNDWNLISNPYPSSISVADFIDANNATTMSNAIYLYNPGTGMNTNSSYSTYNSTHTTQYISSCQGFYVDANTSTDGYAYDISFTNSMRHHTDNDFRSILSFEGVYLDVTDLNGENDPLRMYFDMDAEDGYDSKYDALKLPNGDFNFCTKLDDKKLVFNGMSELTNDARVIPLYFQTAQTSTYTIQLDSLVGSFNNREVLLEDRFMRSFHNLKQDGYSFDSSPKEWANRFYLHIIPKKNNNGSGHVGNPDTTTTVTSVIDLQNDNLKVFYSNQEIIVGLVSSKETIKEIQIIDLNGKVISTKRTNDATVKIPTNAMAAGLFVVKTILSNNDVQINRVVVK